MKKRLRNALFGSVLSLGMLAAYSMPFINNAESTSLQQPTLAYSILSSSTKDSRDNELYKTPFAAVGKQAVALIMPESTGVGNENWTEESKQQVINAVKQSFSFWESQLPQKGQLEMKIAEVYVPKIPFEFVDTPESEHYTKIFNSSLSAIGVASEEQLISSIKEKEKADGAFIIYVANSTNSARKHFPDKANYGSIFPNNKRIVVLSQSPKGSLVNISSHEEGHVFGAADLRPNNPDCIGYGVLNWSSCKGISPTQDELMRNAVPVVSNATKGQTGIIDENGNGIPDSVDKEPKISIILQNDGVVVFDVKTQGIEPVQNSGYPYFNYSKIAGLEAVINGTSYQIQVPQLSKQAKVQLNLSGLREGANELEVRAETQFGNKTSVTTTVNYSLIPPAPKLVSPLQGTLLAQLGGELSWVNPNGITQYQIQVIPFNNDGPGINIIRNAEQRYTIQPPVMGSGNYVMLPGMSYSWRVRASRAATALSENDSGWSPWSEQRTFSTPAVTSLTIIPLLPDEGKTVMNNTPTLQWGIGRDDIFYFEVQVSKIPNFGRDAFLYWELRHGGITNPLNSYAIPEQFPLEPKTQYFWRVRPRVQGDGTPVSWSRTFSFSTN